MSAPGPRTNRRGFRNFFSSRRSPEPVRPPPVPVPTPTDSGYGSNSSIGVANNVQTNDSQSSARNPISNHWTVQNGPTVTTTTTTTTSTVVRHGKSSQPQIQPTTTTNVYNPPQEQYQYQNQQHSQQQQPQIGAVKATTRPWSEARPIAPQTPYYPQEFDGASSAVSRKSRDSSRPHPGYQRQQSSAYPKLSNENTNARGTVINYV